VRGLVFDLDGTLVDSYAAITASLNAARARFDLPPLEQEAVRRRVGRGLECLIADLVGPDRVEIGVDLFREHYAGVFAETTHALPSVPTTLRRLGRAGIRMSVASNKPARFSVPILRGLELLSWFDTVQGPDLAGTTKPDPVMIHACLAGMRIAPGEAAYVGDMPLDVRSAARAGLPVVLIQGGSATEAELRATGQTVLSSLEGLVALLGV
jgi:phosphoglycolate phosphatase